MNSQEQDLLKRAKNEISRLRGDNQRMSARLSMFDDIKMLLNIQIRHGDSCCGPDVVYEIERALELPTEPCPPPQMNMEARQPVPSKSKTTKRKK